MELKNRRRRDYVITKKIKVKNDLRNDVFHIPTAITIHSIIYTEHFYLSIG